MKAFSAALFCLLIPLSADADVLIGLEVSEVDRDLSLFGTAFSEEDGEGLSLSLGTDLKNSFLLLKYSEETSSLDPFAFSFDLREFSAGWHWNETTRKDGYVGVGAKILLSSYDLDSGFLKEDFWGFGLGLTGTKYLVPNRLFFGGHIWLRAYADPGSSDSRRRDEGSASRRGVEGQAFMGISLGIRTTFSIIVGYRIRDIDLGELYFEDERREGFLAMRLYVPAP